jgi:hypothetical protein
MNRWYYIISSLLTVLICSADGCNENPEAVALRETQQTSELIGDVRHAFTVDTLSQNDLIAFEMSAIQKLTDLSDYLNIVSDTTLDFRLRRQGYEMILDLFIPGRYDFKNLSLVCPDWEPKFNDSSDSTSFMQGLPCHIIPSDIYIREHFFRQNDTTYAGAMSFSLSGPLPDKAQIEGDLSRLYTIEIYLIRSIKSFGSQRLNVWDTYLGNIDPGN